MNEIKELKKSNKYISNECDKICPYKNDIKSSRCCDDMFCKIAEEKYFNEYDKYEKPYHLGVRYLSKNGCILPIEKRVKCSLFACDEVLKDKKVAKRHIFLTSMVNIKKFEINK